MFKKNILYKLITLIICFAFIVSMCVWKSSVNNKVYYDVDRYNLLNKVKLTETSDQLLDIAKIRYDKYKKNSFYNFWSEKKMNVNEITLLQDEHTILDFNFNTMIKFFEEQKTNGVDLTKEFIVFYSISSSSKPHTIRFSPTLINNIFKYKDQLERFKKLEENSFTDFKQLNDILKTDVCDLNEFLLMLETKDKSSTSNKHYIKVRKNLMRFYSILFKLYGEDNIKKLVSNFVQGSFEKKSGKAEVAAATFFVSKMFKQHIKLKNSVFCSDMCEQNYISGFWSSFNCAYVLIHEMGHAIDNFFTLNQLQREKLHVTQFNFAVPLFKGIALDPFYDYCSSASITIDSYKNTATIQEYINQSIIEPQMKVKDSGKNISDTLKKEAIFVFAPSQYARRSDEENPDSWQKEFFAECFAYWLLTPEKYRDIRWAIINDYFLNKFGQ